MIFLKNAVTQCFSLVCLHATLVKLHIEFDHNLNLAAMVPQLLFLKHMRYDGTSHHSPGFQCLCLSSTIIPGECVRH
jgi:hypothetical protein